MKLSPLLVAGSLALNAALAFVYFSTSRPATAPSAAVAAVSGSGSKPVSQSKASAAKAALSAAKKNDAVTWAALNKTGDLRALAARLKAAGFSPTVIRAAVGAQLNESFKARREQIMPKFEDRPFWKTDSTGGSLLSSMLSDPKYRAASRELSLEYSRQMKEILGPDANDSSPEYDEYLVRRFGNLPKDKIEQLQRLDQDYNDLRSEVQRAARGVTLPEDREKMAILEREKLADLAQMLTPAEVEDYLMRTSTSTSRLRQVLTSMNATEDEFKALYRVQAAYDEKYSTALGIGAMTVEQRNERQTALGQIEEQFKTALGDARYADLTRASDREYQQLSGMVKQAGVPETAAIAVVDMRENVLNESNRIYDDASLGAEQKRAAIQALAQTARNQALSTLGADVGQKYLQLAERWLSSLERGSAVKLTNTINGGSGMSSRVPRPAGGAAGADRPPGAAGATGSLQFVPAIR